jgi:hypothetical protein
MIDESDEPSTTGVIEMPDFTTAEKGERYLDAAGNAVAPFIHELDGW